jgi:hypothetical protein
MRLFAFVYAESTLKLCLLKPRQRENDLKITLSQLGNVKNLDQLGQVKSSLYYISCTDSVNYVSWVDAKLLRKN